ncbi:hypothetical protein MHBO_005080 [Bonamia ostreae]|uniref:Uncharacterized protein n=1 Tax=Bonamia ostreae TaxID=126728 RepID=A0ABV2AV24_9EUKA
MNKKIIENGLIKTVLYVYLKYPWHNYVHILISQMVARIVEKDVFRLKKTLFLESDIVSVLSKSIDANSAYHSENGANLGSKVHTFRMIHCIKLQAQKDETVQHFCGRSEKWKDCLRFFVQSQEIYAKKIGDANIDCLMNNRRRDYGNVYFG